MRGGTGRNNIDAPSAVSARQRLVVLTFETPEQAEQWDAAGRPLKLDVKGSRR